MSSVKIHKINKCNALALGRLGRQITACDNAVFNDVVDQQLTVQLYQSTVAVSSPVI